MNTNMTIPQCRERLNEIAENLSTMPYVVAQEEIRKVIEQMHRRPAVRRAPVTSRKMTPELRRSIVNMADAAPNMSYQDIGEFYGVSAGRVSEAVAGFRRSNPTPPVPLAPPPSAFYAHAPAL